MYQSLLYVHSWLRWAVLLMAAATVILAALGLSGRRSWSGQPARASRLFTIFLDVQTLVGLLLYAGISPITRTAFQNMGAAMRDATLRFYAVEHLVGMLAAVVLAHIGAVRIRRATSDAAKHRTALIFVGLATVLLLVMIPWPGRPSGRPLFR